MRVEVKKKQREEKRLNVFWWKNKCLPDQFGNDEETPEAQETLMFWRSIKKRKRVNGVERTGPSARSSTK